MENRNQKKLEPFFPEKPGRFPAKNFSEIGMGTPEKIRYRGKDYPVIDSMRLGGQTYLILDRLSGGLPERFWAYTRSGSREGLMWTIHLLPNSKATRTRLETLRRISESNHNVPTLAGYHRYGDQLAAVCKWVHGISVRDYLNAVEKRRRPAFSSFKASQLFRRFAHGLCQLHSIKAVAHGDIKPENVIISPKPHQLVLVDFGSAWVLEQMTRRDRGDGESPLYAAPEVLNGGRLTFASDQFSASMVYYEMLTNRMPYHPIGGQAGNAPAGTLPDDSLKPPSQIAPLAEKTPQRIWQIIDEIALRGLEFTPRKRFPNGKEWRNRLDQLDLEMRTETKLNDENKLLVRLIETAQRLFRK